MTRSFPVLLIFALLAGLAAATPGRADLLVPPEATPPSPAQLQQPPAKQPAPGESTPVALTTEAPATPATPAAPAAPAAQRTRVEVLLRALLAGGTAVLLADAAPQPAALPEGYAKNLALEPVTPRYTVRLGIGAVQSATLGADYLPVTLTVSDAKGKTVATEQFRYREAEEEAFGKAARAFLGKHLPLAAIPAAGPEAPRLHAWIESSDGETVRIGSRIAFYFQASAKGYVSLYHFASSGAVQRIYPTEREPYNFVEAGRIYRYPQSGYLELQGPAGEETIKGILTVLPSNTPRIQPGGLSYKSDPLQVIPTHYPVLFASGDLSRFFALPPHLYTETHIRYTLKPR
ncbi:MAG: DUF4384 domain-containing protein [Candidatus Contendobacter sp.]|nr:DUF4384 domain-containing protein [Candidatus Contendobacter sp.]